MYVYTLKPYLKSRFKKVHSWEYAKEIMPNSSYFEIAALVQYSDVNFYSRNPKLSLVPSSNGVMLPVKFFDVKAAQYNE